MYTIVFRIKTSECNFPTTSLGVIEEDPDMYTLYLRLKLPGATPMGLSQVSFRRTLPWANKLRIGISLSSYVKWFRVVDQVLHSPKRQSVSQTQCRLHYKKIMQEQHRVADFLPDDDFENEIYV